MNYTFSDIKPNTKGGSNIYDIVTLLYDTD